MDKGGVGLRVLVCPDKFKGSLTAAEVCEAIARGWRRGRPEDVLELLPVSDGGDGFGDVARRLMGARSRSLRTVDAAGRPLRARWWWEERTRLGIVESAGIIGLALLPRGRFHPFEMDTTGLGRALGVVARRGARCVLIGLGGSATNDGGFGLARALGWRFLDARGGELTRWTELVRLVRVVPPPGRWPWRRVQAAVDVSNPLLGPRGATRVYGPQKGLRPEDFALAERCLRRLADVMEEWMGRSLACVPGAGAAGGLGFGLMAFAGAELISGFGWVARKAGLERKLRRADLVLTGEGALDRSSLMGKAVGEIARICRRQGKPCLAFAGRFQPWPRHHVWFERVYALVDAVSETTAMRRAAEVLERLATRAATQWADAAAG
jgi:glycerate kinase